MNFEPLGIMTYNAHHGAGNDDCVNPKSALGEMPAPDCALDLPRLANVTKAERPDIIGAQELDRFWARSAMADQPKELSAMLDMDYCFGANVVHPPDAHSNTEHEFGVATYSKFPIVSCENYLLPNQDGWEQRGLLDTRIQIPSIGEVAILNTHLQVGLGSNQAEATRQRIEQALVISNHVAALDIPVIVLGDLNTTADSGEIDSLIGPNSDLTDVWSVAGNGAGETIFAGAAGEPTARIDYILVSSHFRVISAEVIDNESSRMASDHFPLVAILGFEGH